MIRLEAYTLSNRGRSLRIVNTAKSAGWKPVPNYAHDKGQALSFWQLKRNLQPATHIDFQLSCFVEKRNSQPATHIDFHCACERVRVHYI